ncbi:MAG: hypothetical protein ACK5XN_40090 [Bacteroidota bacterium]|jgi:hypothetical protein
MTHNLNYASVNRYADFIEKFHGKTINLSQEIDNFRARDGRGIGRGVRHWVASGIAKKKGPKKYYIEAELQDDPLGSAEKVLKERRRVYPTEYISKYKKQRAQLTEQQAIDFLKSKGYRILKPETQYTEI